MLGLLGRDYLDVMDVSRPPKFSSEHEAIENVARTTSITSSISCPSTLFFVEVSVWVSTSLTR